MCICVCHAHRKVGFAKYSIHAISLANSYKRPGLFESYVSKCMMNILFPFHNSIDECQFIW